MKTRHLWMVTADSRRASIFACQRTPAGELHMHHLQSLENHHEAEHDRGRPTLVGGAERRGTIARSGAHAAPHTGASSHTNEEEQRRFAREVADWIKEARRSAGDHSVTVFAPARFLGILRIEAGESSLNLCEAELTNLRANQLAVHPIVVRAAAEPSFEKENEP